MVSKLVNKHIARVTAAGGTVPDVPWLVKIDEWLGDNQLHSRLFDWADVGIGVVKSGSQISKIMGLGTTLLPRLGDLTPSAPISTLYDTSVFGATVVGWTNTAVNAYSYYGAARNGSTRTNMFRRWYRNGDGLTVVAAYRKSGTGTASFLGMGQATGIYLQNTSGAAGQCKMNIGDVGTGVNFLSNTHPTTLTNAATNIIGGTFNQFDGMMNTYVEGVPGTATGPHTQPYLPMVGFSETKKQYLGLVSGSSTTSISQAVGATDFTWGGIVNEAQFSCASLIIFTAPLTAAQMLSLNGLLRNRLNAVLADNIVSGYSADATGVADCAPAFNNWHTARNNETRPVELTIPAGTFAFKTNAAQFCTKDIKNLTFKGAGIDVTTISRVPPASAWKWGEEGLFQDGSHSAKIQTVAAGSLSAALTTADAGKIGRFATGQRCIMAGIDLQASGDPFNNHFFEFLTIKSISGTTINFTTPVKNRYKETWPSYNDGTVAAGMDQGGAATLYALRSGSDCDFTMQDMTIVGGAGVTDIVGYISGRNGKMIRTKINSPYGWSPTVIENCTWTDCDMRVQMEVDKSADTFNVVRGYVHKIWMQSSSVNLLTITDATCNQVNTTKKNIINGSTINFLQVGPGYGVTESCTVNNSIIAQFEASGPSPRFSIATLGYTCVGGAMQRTIPAAYNLKPETWAVPGCWISFYNAAGLWIACAKVLDIWRDATKNYIQTSLAAGFPANADSFVQHPCANWHGAGNTGCLQIVDHSQAGAQGKPLFSYCLRTYDNQLPSSGLAIADFPYAIGKIVSIKVNVTTPYTGSQSNLLFHLSSASNWPITRADGTTSYSMAIAINAKIVGERVFVPGSSSVLSGDTAVFPTGTTTLTAGDIMNRNSNSTPVYKNGGSNVSVAGETAGPVITLEIICDQGVS